MKMRTLGRSIICLVIGFIFVIPILLILMNAFKPNREIMTSFISFPRCKSAVWRKRMVHSPRWIMMDGCPPGASDASGAAQRAGDRAACRKGKRFPADGQAHR